MFRVQCQPERMDKLGEKLVAVVCDDRPALRGPVVRLLEASGFLVAAVTDSFSALTGLAVQNSPRLAVVALPLTGMGGLGGVRALRVDAPGCEVVLISPSASLELAALEAGARALVPEDDLRVLRAVLGQIAASAVHARLPPARVHGEDVSMLLQGSESTNPSS